MELIIGIIGTIVVISIFSYLKKENKNLNDSFPFDPRDYNPLERK